MLYYQGCHNLLCISLFVFFLNFPILQLFMISYEKNKKVISIKNFTDFESHLLIDNCKLNQRILTLLYLMTYHSGESLLVVYDSFVFGSVNENAPVSVFHAIRSKTFLRPDSNVLTCPWPFLDQKSSETAMQTVRKTWKLSLSPQQLEITAISSFFQIQTVVRLNLTFTCNLT